MKFRVEVEEQNFRLTASEDEYEDGSPMVELLLDTGIKFSWKDLDALINALEHIKKIQEDR